MKSTKEKKLELKLNYYNVRFNNFKKTLSIFMKPIINVDLGGEKKNN
jgi:hypothetical protein